MSAERIRVEIDHDLEDLIPGYLNNVHANLQKIAEAADRGDLDECRKIGHNLKGSGGGYGFAEITRYGKLIEEGGKSGDPASIRAAVKDLEAYLARVDVAFV
jgi:HPt (histidine-containing phosphotransfer) domain-containing protein